VSWHCLTATKDIDDEGDRDSALEEFLALRGHCAALAKILLPGAGLEEFVRRHKSIELAAQHRSTLLLAYQRGNLPQITGPLHRFLLDGDSIRPDVSVQYQKDLRERWFESDLPGKRHKDSRAFWGRVAELQVAAWLEVQGHTIVEMEATSSAGARCPDIVADHNGARTAYEVKAIGQDDADFALTLDPPGSWGWQSPCDAMNYLLVRVYEAAKQLRSRAESRTAVIVVTHQFAWSRFELQLREGWVDWRNPAFVGFEPQPKVWLAQNFPTLSPELPRDLGIIRELDRLLILRQNGDLTLSLMHEIQINN